jgi:hypothetical protein
MLHETVVYRRDELYSLVWSTPVRDVARNYGVSDVALAKICRRLNIPVPGRGYWARVAAGQRLKRRPLAPLKKGEPDEIRVRRWRTPSAPKGEGIEERSGTRKDDNEEAIRVRPLLDDPHELVALSAAALRKTKVDDDGIARCRGRRCLAIEVAPESLDRALRIMDSLLRALEVRNLRVEVLAPAEVRVWMPGACLREFKMPVSLIHVADEAVPFAIEEIAERVQVDPGQATPRAGGHRRSSACGRASFAYVFATTWTRTDSASRFERTGQTPTSAKSKTASMHSYVALT